MMSVMVSDTAEGLVSHLNNFFSLCSVTLPPCTPPIQPHTSVFGCFLILRPLPFALFLRYFSFQKNSVSTLIAGPLGSWPYLANNPPAFLVGPIHFCIVRAIDENLIGNKHFVYDNVFFELSN